MDPEVTNQESKTSKRKLKKLYLKIKNQMEFYFSDSNLAKDKYLYDLVSRDPVGFVDLQVFTTFNKIKELTDDCDIIAAAVSRSSLFEVSVDQKRVRRVTPIEFKDFDACTLYVEKLPEYADQKWVRDVFGQFGAIKYVNVPRYKTTNNIKRFAFVEFEEDESVKRACEFYKTVCEKECTTSEDESKNIKSGNKHKYEESSEKLHKRRKTASESSDKLTNSPFKSNKSHHQSSGSFEKSIDKTKSYKRKRKGDRSADERTPKKAKGHAESISTEVQRSIKPDESSSVKKQLKSILVTKNSKNVELVGNISQLDVKVEPIEDSKIQPNSKAEKDLIGDDESQVKSVEIPTNLNPELQLEEKTTVLDDGKSKRKRRNSKKHRSHLVKPALRVMPKSEWKVYRNKYLELQRSTMSTLKKHILLELKQLKEQEISSKSVETPNTKKAVHFQPGVILKIGLPEPVKSAQDIKDQVKGHATVAYIDAPVESSEIFLRCHSSDDALGILKEDKLKTLGEVKLLTDDDEKNYWDKIENDRKIKYSNPIPNKKRGRDKLIAKAAKLEEMKNKHIFFEE